MIQITPFTQDSEPGRRLEGKLTLREVDAARARLDPELDQHRALQLNLAGLTELDTAGVQFLVWLKQEARRRGVGLRFAAHSPAVLEAFDLLRVAALFGDGMVLVPDSFPPVHSSPLRGPALALSTTDAPGWDGWHLSIWFGRDALRDGIDPLSCIRSLAALGEIVQLTSIFGQLPEREAFDPAECRLRLAIELDTLADRQTIEDILQGLGDSSTIRLIPPHSKVEEYIRLIQDLPEEARFLGETLVTGGCLTAHELETALQRQQKEFQAFGKEQSRRLGTILIQENEVPSPVVAAALAQQKRTRDRQVVKVPTAVLDLLVDLVGDLVDAGASASARAAQPQGLGPNPQLMDATLTVNNLLEEIRDSAQNLREAVLALNPPTPPLHARAKPGDEA